MDLMITVFAMYMTSSTAEMINGGLLSMGLLILKDSPVGHSSSWNAFSTDRRKKKVVRTLYGKTSLPETFRLRFDLVSTSGMVNGTSSGTPGSCDNPKLAMNVSVNRIRKTYHALLGKKLGVSGPPA